MKTVIWGMGKHMYSYLTRKGLYKNDKIVAFVDNNPFLWDKNWKGIPILSPWKLIQIDFEQVLICAADEISIRRQLMSYSVCEVKWKGKNEYLSPICSDDPSDGSEALLDGGSKIVRYIHDEMQVIDIPVAEMDLHKCLRESGYTARDLYSRPGNKEGIYREDSLFGISEYIEMIKLV